MSNTDIVKKLLFRSSHRGTKEMDIVLGGYFKKNHSNLSEVDLKEFEKLLHFSDKILTDYFVMYKPYINLEIIIIVKKLKIHLEDHY